MASMGDGMVSRQAGHFKQTLDLCCRFMLTGVFLRDWTVSKIGKIQGVTEIDQKSQRRGQPV
jgi:hypothetical protein